MSEQHQKDAQPRTAFPIRATKPNKESKPDLEKVSSVVLCEGPRSKKEAIYLVVRSRHTGEIKHDSITIKSFGRKSGELYEKPEHSVTLSSEKTDEIRKLVDFTLASRSGSVPNESGDFVVIGTSDGVSKDSLVRFLSDLSASGKIEVLADVLGQISYDRHLLTSLLERAAQNPKLFAEAAAALNLVTYKQSFDELERLVAKANVQESELQTLLKDNPWMFRSSS